MVAGGADGRQRLLFGLDPGVARERADRWTSRCGRSGRSSTGSLAVRRLRRVLVGSQFAIATPLLVVAGLLLASLNELRHVDLGFDSHNVLSGADPIAGTNTGAGARRCVLGRAPATRWRRVPGVSGVAFADGRPPERRRQLQQLRSRRTSRRRQDSRNLSRRGSP